MKTNNIVYTKSELEQLSVILGATPESFLYTRLYRRVTETIEAHQNNESIIEVCLINSEIKDPKVYATYESYGESRYFTILNIQGNLTFQFWRRHLKRFLFEAELKEMPLLINVPRLKDLAAWRLKIGK